MLTQVGSLVGAAHSADPSNPAVAAVFALLARSTGLLQDLRIQHPLNKDRMILKSEGCVVTQCDGREYVMVFSDGSAHWVKYPWLAYGGWGIYVHPHKSRRRLSTRIGTHRPEPRP